MPCDAVAEHVSFDGNPCCWNRTGGSGEVYLWGRDGMAQDCQGDLLG